MSIPQYQEFMNPALQALKDGQTKHIAEIEKTVASLLHLTKQNMQEFLPSRKQSVVRNRLNWALYYMYRAGLLSKGGRGFYTITQEGKNALSSGNIINKSFLKNTNPLHLFLIFLITNRHKHLIQHSMKMQIRRHALVMQ